MQSRNWRGWLRILRYFRSGFLGRVPLILCHRKLAVVELATRLEYLLATLVKVVWQDIDRSRRGLIVHRFVLLDVK